MKVFLSGLYRIKKAWMKTMLLRDMSIALLAEPVKALNQFFIFIYTFGRQVKKEYHEYRKQSTPLIRTADYRMIRFKLFYIKYFQRYGSNGTYNTRYCQFKLQFPVFV